MGDLHDGGFEGSTNEHHIFTKIFLGNDQDKTNKKCLVTGAINFQCDKSKQTELLGSANSEISAISSRLNVSFLDGLNEKSRSVFSPNGHALLPRADEVTNGKRIKLSLDEQPVFNSVSCRLVESTSQGITSSCYLVKGDASMYIRPSFNENDKDISASKAIYAPTSLETSVKKSRSFRTRGKQTVKSNINNLSGDETLSHKDCMKSPRPLLRKYIQALLEASGWEIAVRTKENKGRWGYIYFSPKSKRPIRVFPKVWNLCGQSLFINRTLPVLEDGKQWKDMTSFWSDLSLTLSKIDEKSSLEQQWCLLDPFVNAMFIDKKLELLKLGVVVDARNSVIDPHVSEGAAKSTKKRKVTGNPSQKGSPNGLCESFPVGGSVLTNSEANNYACNDSCGTRITIDLGQLNRGTVKALNGLPVSLSEERCTLSGTTDGLNHNDLQTNGLDFNSDHSSSCKFQVPPQNGFMLADSVSPPQDGSTNSPGSGTFLSQYIEEMALEIDRTMQIESSEGVPSGSEDLDCLREDIHLKTPQAQSAKLKKKSAPCQIEDNALLISAFIKKKSSRCSKKSIRKIKACKSKPLRKRKTQKGSCRLLPRSLGMGEKHNEGKWFKFGSRTVLSWLISCGTVSLKEVIQYRNLKDNSVVKEGIITKDGIRCKCCNRLISVSEFKFHAGFGLNHPGFYLVMGSGKSFTLCQLEAWFDEYKTRKSATRPIEVELLDENDDSCGLCGGGGELICCDNCPSTFHQKCLCEQELPEGDWYCQHCTCRICGDLVIDKEAAVSSGALKCSQCDHKYHEACLKDKFVSRDTTSETRFCGGSCQEVYLGVQSQVGVLNSLSDGYSWTLLRCIEGDQKYHPVQNFVALKSECNSKLAVALTLMEECFLSMVDARTGIDMIPHVLYNWRSEFARLDYHGFYTMVLEKDDVLISAASFRIHGVAVAEMPLIATCSKYRRQGMCRRIMNSIEEMLISFKVEKLVITAIPDLVETWTIGFGFEPLEDHERNNLSHVNLMVFPGTVWLKKTMYKQQAANELTSSGHAAPCEEGQAEMAFNFDSAIMEDEREFSDIRKSIPDQVECQEASNLGRTICIINDNIEEDGK